VGLEADECGSSPTEAALPYAPEPFDLFYRREYEVVVSLTYVLCGRRTIAEELAQEAFIATHRRWQLVGRYDDPGAFVRRVAANAAVSYRRRVSAEARALARLAAGWRPETTPLPPDAAEFWKAVRDLPRRQAQVVALFYLEDRSADEIALILGCAAPTVRVHLHRARSTLARRLGVQGGGE
jgi:RNA polymerase sigma factor (sigma-70 family)